MDIFCQTFEAAIPRLKKDIMISFASHTTSIGFRSIWEHFEEIIIPVLCNFLSQPPLNITSVHNKVPGKKAIELIPNYIIQTTSKSKYPDLEVVMEGKRYGIDIKSGEVIKPEPWYDIGRLDTYQKKHLDQFKAEYCITVLWQRSPAEVLDIFIEPTYKSVGYKFVSSNIGIKYRPYDGKIRPKSWSDFKAGKSYWQNIEEFKIALERSQFYRQRSYITEWYKKFDQLQRNLIQEDLIQIDRGIEIVVDPEILEDQEEET